MEEVKKYKHKKNIFLCVQATIPKDIDKNASENKAYLDDTEYREYSIKAFEAIMQDLRHIKHLGKDEILGPAVKD